ncbi:hypothetical protein [Azorhizobium caulinodans]|uniref:hypothetical protein n=1 Tax=Azorhizobium caulinodans TaxID=7 RepID=UPI002FBDA69B
MDDALVEKVARAIDNTDVGYTIQLTRLVDDEATYTLTFSDGRQTRTFSEASDARAEAEAALSSARARAAIQAVQEAQWPHASPEDAKGGWTISPSHLQRVQAAVEAANIGYPQWEEIEAILLFQAGMPLPSFPKEGDNG